MGISEKNCPNQITHYHSSKSQQQPLNWTQSNWMPITSNQFIFILKRYSSLIDLERNFFSNFLAQSTCYHHSTTLQWINNDIKTGKGLFDDDFCCNYSLPSFITLFAFFVFSPCFATINMVILKREKDLAFKNQRMTFYWSVRN